MLTRRLIYLPSGNALENQTPVVHVDKDQKIFADGLYVGFWFIDPDEDGTFLMLAGQPCKKFRDVNTLKLWLVKRMTGLYPIVRDYLVAKFREVHPYAFQSATSIIPQ